ncbi:hypothetical protein [Rhodoferax sp.]|uniref:hypothetical protein n=1 Tax=Rhodoferax sp. TaxID=50421 RepID=UPI00262BBDC8|nr:hypothetical protein [Rhodoferax sp.]MDD2809551.1 hypothetical protein [Rhodoferax sp.]MDD5481085.1 hypothetical protein [Rhodoferax sp.]
MLDFLRDQAWQFFGIVISVAVAIWIYRAQSSRAELAFGVLSARELLTIHDSLSSRVTVTLDGALVRDVSLLVFAFKNSGNRPFRAGDFAVPATFEFGSTVRLLSAEISRRSPENLEARIDANESKLVLQPLLLNQGEYVVIQALVAGRNPKVSCNVRVDGVSKLQPISRQLVDRRSIERSLGETVLSLLLRMLLCWFVINLVDSITNVKLAETLTINGSFAFGLVVLSIATAILEKLAGWFRSRFFSGKPRRVVDDA